MDELAVQEKVERYFEYVGADVDRVDELYQEDAVLEFPQSGERFEGAGTFTQWRRQYPAEPGSLAYRLRRVTVRTDFAAVEISVSYDGGTTWMQAVQLLDFRDGRIARERIYFMEAFEAPQWRAPWRSPNPADPPS